MKKHQFYAPREQTYISHLIIYIYINVKANKFQFYQSGIININQIMSLQASNNDRSFYRNIMNEIRLKRHQSITQSSQDSVALSNNKGIQAYKKLQRFGAYIYTINELNDKNSYKFESSNLKQDNLSPSNIKVISPKMKEKDNDQQQKRDEISLLRNTRKRALSILQTEIKGQRKQIYKKNHNNQLISIQDTPADHKLSIIKKISQKGQERNYSLIAQNIQGYLSKSKDLDIQGKINRISQSRYVTEHIIRLNDKSQRRTLKNTLILNKIDEFSISKKIKQQIEYVLTNGSPSRSKHGKRVKSKGISKHNSIKKCDKLQIIDQVQDFKKLVMMPNIHATRIQRFNKEFQSIPFIKHTHIKETNLIKDSKEVTTREVKKNCLKRRNKTEINKSYQHFISSQEDLSVYDLKIKSYRELIFIINISHRIFDPLIIRDMTSFNSLEKHAIPKYAYFIGGGNNANLIRSLMKRRPWWHQTHDSASANFVWSQLIINVVIEHQKDCFRIVQKHAQKQEKIEQISIAETKNILKQDIEDNIFSSKHKSPNKKTKISSPSHANQMTSKTIMYKPAFDLLSDKKILTEHDSTLYRRLLNSLRTQQFDKFQQRLKYLPKDYLTLKTNDPHIIHNHFQYNHYLGNKKSLFYFLSFYYNLLDEPIQDVIPKTFHVRSTENDKQYEQFFNYFMENKKKNMNLWIIKPGQNSNRGSGIHIISNLKQLHKIIKENKKNKHKSQNTFIIQKYIQRPLLYKGRKFDLRHYMVITGLYGHLRAYWYGQGYVRTSSNTFNLLDFDDPLTHLTNDAIQKQSNSYGKFQEANKISYNELQNYFHKNYPNKNFDFPEIYKKMRQIATKSVESVYLALQKSRKLHSFEIFGLDFMIEDNLNIKLIQINTNPCLQLSSNLLSRIIPSMIQQSLRLSIDVIYPQNIHYNNNFRPLAPDCTLEKLNFQLIFDQIRDRDRLQELYSENMAQFNTILTKIQENKYDQQQIYENEGLQVQINRLEI